MAGPVIAAGFVVSGIVKPGLASAGRQFVVCHRFVALAHQCDALVQRKRRTPLLQEPAGAPSKKAES